MCANPTSFRLRRAVVRYPSSSGRQWLSFDHPRETLEAWSVDEVLDVIDRAEQAASDGAWVVGLVSFDAGPAFDSAIVARRDVGVPLASFGVFDQVAGDERPEGGPFMVSPWAPSLERHRYKEAFRRVKYHIARGDTYQVNLTLRLRAAFAGDPLGLFDAMTRVEQGQHIAFLDLGDAAVCSASPELFFRRVGPLLLSRPMKGTRPRHSDPATDRALAEELLHSKKDQAENTMIVDMTRNDFCRVAESGSVEVPRLHQIERYRTVHQLTSTVTATSSASLSEIFTAAFPAASITGAPKIRTCELISEIERQPRGVYTGTIGVIAPGGDCEWNVAIRTAWVDLKLGRAEYGIGGGIVWDSTADDEWEEAQHKARVLVRASQPFRLLESLAWHPESGPTLLKRHLDRLAISAATFGFHLDRDHVERQLLAVREDTAKKLRLLLAHDGEVDLEVHDLMTNEKEPWELPLDDTPVDRHDEFLYHKTTRRTRYDVARARFPEAPDVILWNEQRQLTETTRGNLVVHLNGVACTPPVSCGLLAGTMRAELLESGDIVERVVHVNDLMRAEAVEMINSVRGRIPIKVRDLPRFFA